MRDLDLFLQSSWGKNPDTHFGDLGLFLLNRLIIHWIRHGLARLSTQTRTVSFPPSSCDLIASTELGTELIFSQIILELKLSPLS